MKALLSEGINRPRKGHDAGDHPPITPMKAATEVELGIDKLDSVRTLRKSVPGGLGAILKALGFNVKSELQELKREQTLSKLNF
mgnify:CR=1 FL=1